MSQSLRTPITTVPGATSGVATAVRDEAPKAQLLRVILRGSWTRLALVVVAGVAAGLSTSAVLAVINDLVGASPSATLAHYAILAVFSLLLGAASQLLVNRLATDALLDLRLTLCRQMAMVPLSTVESIGGSTMLAVLTEDASAVAAAITLLPGVIISASTVIGSLVYLGVISPFAFAALLVVILFGVATASKFLDFQAVLEGRTRREIGTLFSRFRALVDGAKELRLDAKLRQGFLADGVAATASLVRRHSLASKTASVAVGAWTRGLLFAALGLTMAGRFGEGVAASFVLVLIYVMTPLESIMAYLPVWSRAVVGADNMQSIGIALRAEVPTGLSESPGPIAERATIELSEISYSYRSDVDNQVFSLGPVDFTFDEGRIIFIVGGNGSGKSTLAKTVAGLYAPAGGELRLNDRLITDANRDWYRQHFAAVFADYYLFETVWGASPVDVRERANRHIEDLQLAHKVTFDGRSFSTTALSSGQRKRLALVCALLTDRPVYIFDEWASDQDPVFKRVFYEEILVDLRRRGKTVIVVSHDDRYFPIADTLMKLEDGRVTGDSTVAFMRRIRGSVPPPK